MPKAEVSAARRGAGRRLLKRLKNDLVYLLVRLGLAVLDAVPVRLLLASGPSIGRLAYLVAASGRARARENVSRSTLGASPRADRALVRAAFLQLGRNAMECIALRRLPMGSPIHDVITFAEGAEACLRGALGAGRGVVLVTAHLGNWELMGALVAKVGRLCVLARASYDPRLTGLMERFRQANGLETAWIDGSGASRALRRARARLLDGAIVGLLADLPPRRGGCEVGFLGRQARASTLAAGLSLVRASPLLYGYVQRGARGGHRVHLERLSLEGGCRRDVKLRLTQAIARRIEETIRCTPDQWLWTLDRWRGT